MENQPWYSSKNVKPIHYSFSWVVWMLLHQCLENFGKCMYKNIVQLKQKHPMVDKKYHTQ
jgi:hypothetical protein